MTFVPVLLFLIGCISLARGQSPVYPDVFSGYFYNQAIVDPSYIPEEGNLLFSTYYKFRPGTFSDINTFMLSAEKIIRNRGQTTQAVRVFMLNERQGSYISKPSGYLNYAVQLALSSDLLLSVGTSLGFAELNFTAPSGGGSSIIPDGRLGISTRYKKISAGISSGQIFNSEGRPVSTLIQLNRFFNYHLETVHTLSPFLDFRTYFLWRSFPHLKDQYYLTGTFDYRKTAEAGLIFKFQRGLSLVGSVQVNREGNPLFVSFVYNSSFFSSVPVWNNSYEIGIRYGVK